MKSYFEKKGNIAFRDLKVFIAFDINSKKSSGI